MGSLTKVSLVSGCGVHVRNLVLGSSDEAQDHWEIET